ncbi:MAG: hypothetical protein AAGC74_07210 [Verrucomicrobiota bacterium]
MKIHHLIGANLFVLFVSAMSLRAQAKDDDFANSFDAPISLNDIGVSIHTTEMRPLTEFISGLEALTNKKLNIIYDPNILAQEPLIPPVEVRNVPVLALLETLGFHGDFKTTVIESDSEDLNHILSIKAIPKREGARSETAHRGGTEGDLVWKPAPQTVQQILQERKTGQSLHRQLDAESSPLANSLQATRLPPLKEHKPKIQVVPLGGLDPKSWDRHTMNLKVLFHDTLQLVDKDANFHRTGRLLILRTAAHQAADALSIAKGYLESIAMAESRAALELNPLKERSRKLREELENAEQNKGTEHPHNRHLLKLIGENQDEIDRIESYYGLR